MEKAIAMLWMRGRLSFLEGLCIRSFQDAGHPVVLYSYEELDGVPDGVECRSAADVLAERDEIVHGKSGSPAPHADLFRYRLLSQNDDLIWADTDAYCRKPFATDTGHFYGWESDHEVNIGVLGLPSDSETLARLVEFTSDEYAIPHFLDPAYVAELEAAKARGEPVHVGDQVWAVWGPKAFTHFLHETGEIRHALPQVALYPYAFSERRKLFRPGVDHAGVITDETLSIHLYGRRARKRLAEKDHGLPHPDSLIGSLLLKHKVDPCEAPLPDWPEPDRNAPFARQYREAAGGKQYASAAVENVRPLDKVVAVTTMRNEGPFILDWVAHHIAVGVTHFLVYTNGCDDPTEEILDALAARGLVTRVSNPVGEGQKPQRVALDAAWSHPLVQEADAAIAMDVDEYINIHVGEGRLEDVFRAAGDPDLISMTWRLFGNGGVVTYDDRPVAEQFTRAAPALTRKPHQSWGFKTILRRDAPFAGFGVHRPHGPTGDMPRWTNGSGQQMPERYLDSGWRSGIDCWGYDLVSLNHYAIRSCDSFLVKRDRGRTNHIARPQGVAYWNAFNRNDEEDTSIQARLGAGRALRFAFGQDPVLGALHQKAVDWHKARIADLKTNAREAAFFAHVTRAPGARDLDEIDLPGPTDVPKTQVAGTEAFALRPDPPAIGQDAEAVYQNLVARTQKKQPMLMPLPNPPEAKRITIVTSMKNEGVFILEWIAYHLSIGVTHFVVYTNDCDDPTNAILDRLQVLGIVTRLDNPFDGAAGQKPQRGALNDAVKREAVMGADWVGVIDVDEFVNIHVGNGTFGDLLNAAHDPNVISMTWRFFGNRGIHAYEDRWQTEQFTACAPLFLPKPRLGWGFKSFFRPDGPFSKLGVHRPLDLDPDRLGEVRWVNGAGRQMPDRVAQKNEWFSRKDTIGYDMVTLNHYVLRSAESFLVKRQRGRINHVDQDQGFQYWATRNYATETDTSIHGHLPRAREELGRLLADQTLFDLHLSAVGWHKDRIAALLEEPEYQALYKAITNPQVPDAIWRARPPKGDVLAAE